MPHRGGKIVRRNLKTNNTLLAGRKWWKSTLGLTMAIEDMLKGRRFGWFVPVFDQASEVWEGLRKAGNGTFKLNEQRRTVSLPGGGSGFFRSMDRGEVARSKNLDSVYIDEVQDIKQEDYNNVILPMLLSSGNPFILKMGTVKPGWLIRSAKDLARSNPDHAFWQIPAYGLKVVREDGGPPQLVRAPHPLENDRLSRPVIDALWGSMSVDSFRQEILSELVALEGRVFPMWKEETHVRPCPFDPDLPTSMGVDFGFRTFAATFHQTEKSGVDRQFAEYKGVGITQEAAIIALAKRSYAKAVKMIGCDPAGDSRNTQTGIRDVELLRKHFPWAEVRFSRLPRHAYPRRRAEFMRDLILTATGQIRSFVDPSCRHSITMYSELIYPKKMEGHEESEKPVKDGENDHFFDAVGYHHVNLYDRSKMSVSPRKLV